MVVDIYLVGLSVKYVSRFIKTIRRHSQLELLTAGAYPVLDNTSASINGIDLLVESSCYSPPTLTGGHLLM